MNSQEIDELLKNQYIKSRLPHEKRNAMLEQIVQKCTELPQRTVAKRFAEENKNLRIRRWQKFSTFTAALLLLLLVSIAAVQPNNDPDFVRSERFFENTHHLTVQHQTRIAIWWSHSLERGCAFPRIAF